jgi:hypothetical protein
LRSRGCERARHGSIQAARYLDCARARNDISMAIGEHCVCK